MMDGNCCIQGCQGGIIDNVILFRFPKDLRLARQWLKLVTNRAISTDTSWKLPLTGRICSAHFVDGRPTTENPCPTENLNLLKKDRANIAKTMTLFKKPKTTTIAKNADQSGEISSSDVGTTPALPRKRKQDLAALTATTPRVGSGIRPSRRNGSRLNRPIQKIAAVKQSNAKGNSSEISTPSATASTANPAIRVVIKEEIPWPEESAETSSETTDVKPETLDGPAESKKCVYKNGGITVIAQPKASTPSSIRLTPAPAPRRRPPAYRIRNAAKVAFAVLSGKDVGETSHTQSAKKEAPAIRRPIIANYRSLSSVRTIRRGPIIQIPKTTERIPYHDPTNPPSPGSYDVRQTRGNIEKQPEKNAEFGNRNSMPAGMRQYGTFHGIPRYRKIAAKIVDEPPPVLDRMLPETLRVEQPSDLDYNENVRDIQFDRLITNESRFPDRFKELSKFEMWQLLSKCNQRYRQKCEQLRLAEKEMQNIELQWKLANETMERERAELFTWSRFVNDDDATTSWTGFPSFMVMEQIYNKYIKLEGERLIFSESRSNKMRDKKRQRQLPTKDEFLFMMVYLRTSIATYRLAFMFNIKPQYAKNIVHAWMPIVKKIRKHVNWKK